MGYVSKSLIQLLIIELFLKADKARISEQPVKVLLLILLVMGEDSAFCKFTRENYNWVVDTYR